MCGITGFIDFSGKSGEDVLHQMTDCLSHRGPDDSGYEIYLQNECSIGFGFRRLSIIDLSPLGHQPMNFEEAGLSIIFNGEIYNYREIRKELEQKGCRFKSNSDTEVILQSYHLWGLKCIDKFIGMFAIAIYDRKKEQVVLIRDRAGVKPLFYYHDQDTFLFASELKSFHRHSGFKKKINYNSLAIYFQHGYISAPHCIFENCFKLLPGHYLVFDLKRKNYSVEKYWDVTDAYNKPILNISFDEALTETEKILQKAFNYRMVADVPVGMFLSGGYDSSLVSALLQKEMSKKLKTFTIGFEEEEFNEAEYARKVAQHLGTEHYEYTCTYKEAMEIIPMLPEMYDEPFADSSAVPTYLVSKKARQQVTVALSADGGDEIFAGYTKYIKCLNYYTRLMSIPTFAKTFISWQTDLAQKIYSNPSLAVPDRVEKLKLLLKANEPVAAFNIITQLMTQAEVQKLFNKEITFPATPFEGVEKLNTHSVLNHFLWADYKTFLVDDILQKVDRASMAVSLEAREPFLDHHIVEWVAQLPEEFKVKNGVGKFLLREIAHKYVPKEIMERPKMGFQVPVERWMRDEQRDLLLSFTNRASVLKYGLLNEKEVEKMVQHYLNRRPGIDFSRVWKVLMLQMWMEKWMN